MAKAPLLEGALFDCFALCQNVWAPFEVDICRSEITEALIPLGVASNVRQPADSAGNCSGRRLPRFAIPDPRARSSFQAGSGFQGLVPSFNLALSLGTIWRSKRMLHVLTFPPVCQVAGKVTPAFVGQEPRPRADPGCRAALALKSQLQRVSHIPGRPVVPEV